MQLKNKKTTAIYTVSKEEYDSWPKETKNKFTVVSEKDAVKQTVSDSKEDKKPAKDTGSKS